MEKKTNQLKTACGPSYLRKNQSTVAGLEALGASCTQARVSHLLTSYDYEISFADSVRFNANVHKILFALERLRMGMLRLGNWANEAVAHRCLGSLKCSKCNWSRQ